MMLQKKALPHSKCVSSPDTLGLLAQETWIPLHTKAGIHKSNLIPVKFLCTKSCTPASRKMSQNMPVSGLFPPANHIDLGCTAHYPTTAGVAVTFRVESVWMRMVLETNVMPAAIPGNTTHWQERIPCPAPSKKQSGPIPNQSV